MTHLEIVFTTDKVMKIDVAEDVDLHKINGNYLVFDNQWINLANVLFISKEAENETDN